MTKQAAFCIHTGPREGTEALPYKALVIRPKPCYTKGSIEKKGRIHMAKKQFKAESKRLLDMMIHSIYTHREIFLRELISNASDAIDKLYYRSLSENLSGVSREDFAIRLTVDRESRTVTIADNGIGMTKEELEQNLGTIAKSGSLKFKQEAAEVEDVDIIGQFGVGFYSAFMVSDRVCVNTRPFGGEEAWCWESAGADGYTVSEGVLPVHGTVIELHLKPNTDEENYDEFLDEWRLRDLVKRYSDYIRYPIKLGDDTLNSMVPLWKKNKNELTAEDYNAFYKEKFYDFEDPLRHIHSAAEGAATYNALLFIPARAPHNYYTREFEKGLQLYASGVLIMDKCADLLPDYFGFVRGLVDSADLSLNISREMLQHDRQLKIIASRIEKKIQTELQAMLLNDREKYEQFFDQFGLQLKYGIYADFGRHKEALQDLLLFKWSGESKTVSLAEYVEAMPEEQKYIYYACGEREEQLRLLPQAEAVLDRGYAVLYLTDDVDEFALKMLATYKDKEFRSVSGGDLGFETEEQKRENSAEEDTLLEKLGKALTGKCTAVRLSPRLKTHPVCLVSEGEISLEMEKVLRAMPNSAPVAAQRVLELNPTHPVFQTLLRVTDEEKLADYAALLYDQALLIEGLPVEDPVAFSHRLCDLMAEKA